ncbi:unnamed protein product [Musa acuminata subsp. burmannicoides]
MDKAVNNCVVCILLIVLYVKICCSCYYHIYNLTELCRFSGAKIYPGKGIRFVRSDSPAFLLASSKCKRYFHNRLKPAKLTWTAMYRKQHKKDIHAEAVKKRCHTIHGPLLKLLWKSFRRGELRRLKFVMLLGKQHSEKSRKE